jgi:gliding motility-associated-like protein
VIEEIETLSHKIENAQLSNQAVNVEQNNNEKSAIEESQQTQVSNSKMLDFILQSSPSPITQPTPPHLTTEVLPVHATTNVNVVDNNITKPSEDPVLQEATMPDIPVSTPVKIEIPNVITPNGDGYNDHFIIVGIEHVENSRLTIWNSKRNIVFTSKNYNNNWGTDAEQGTYTYQFEYIIHGISESRKGTLSVVR